MIADIIGLAGEGGGKGHLNFLPGVLPGDGDGATPAGKGLGKGLAAKEVEPGVASGGGVGGGFDWLTDVTESLLTTETPLLQQ